MKFITSILFLLIIFSEYSLAKESFSSSYSSIKKDEKAYNYLNIAASFKESGDYRKAKEVLGKIDISGNNIVILRYLARLNYLQGDNKKALEILRSLKEDWITLLYSGLIYEDIADESAAIRSYLGSLRLKSNSIALLRLGKIYRKNNNYQKAIDYFLKLINLDPSIRFAYYYLGECYYKIGRYEDAYGYLSKAANFYPGYSPLKSQLGIVKKKLGDDFFIAAKEKKEKKRKEVKLKAYDFERDIPLVKVGLADEVGRFSFLCGGKFTVKDKNNTLFKGEPDKIYSLVLKDGKILLNDYENKNTYKVFDAPLVVSSVVSKDKMYPFYVFDMTYGQNNFWHKQIDRAYRGILEVAIKNNKLVLINTLSVEEYIYGVLSAEIPAYSPPEALRAQAVAARTLAFRNIGRHKKENFDFCADVHCQVYHGLSAETPSTNTAVQDTRGEVITYDGKAIEAFYHSNSGGCLCSDTFGELGYLVEQIDAKEGELPVTAYEQELWFLESPRTYVTDNLKDKFRWQRIYDAEDVRIAFDFELDKLKTIIPTDKGDCFHYKEIQVITIKDTRILKGGLNIRKYFDQLKSSSFKIEVKFSEEKKPKMILFFGGGFGHGAGMSQEGAIGMAERKHRYQEILKHYYPNTQIQKKY